MRLAYHTEFREHFRHELGAIVAVLLVMLDAERGEKESLIVIMVFLSVAVHLLDVGEHRVIGLVGHLKGEDFRVGILEATEGTEAWRLLDEATEEGVVRPSSAEGIHNVKIVIEGEGGVTQGISGKGADDTRERRACLRENHINVFHQMVISCPSRASNATRSARA